MKRTETQIRNDILKECNIPNILDKIKPYAEEQALSFQEEKRTVKLNFHRPAKVLISCLSFAIVALLVVIIVVPKGGKGFASFDSAPEADWEESNYSNKESEAASGKPDADNQNETSASSPDNLDDFYNYYDSNIKNDKLERNELQTYYNEISTYVHNGLTLDEVKENYKVDDVIPHEESIELIYNYLDK